ncbi:MAG: hypothetical protein LBB55_01260, partial [Zoogloeaceae bacterium]|nr:hypothetical protein [Zoogloeaceae bacterium]
AHERRLERLDHAVFFDHAAYPLVWFDRHEKALVPETKMEFYGVGKQMSGCGNQESGIRRQKTDENHGPGVRNQGSDENRAKPFVIMRPQARGNPDSLSVCRRCLDRHGTTRPAMTKLEVNT